MITVVYEYTDSTHHIFTKEVQCDSYTVVDGGVLQFRKRMESNAILVVKDWITAYIKES